MEAGSHAFRHLVGTFRRTLSNAVHTVYLLQMSSKTFLLLVLLAHQVGSRLLQLMRYINYLLTCYLWFQAEIRQLKEQLAVEKEVWAENYRKKTDAQLLARERELQQQVKQARDADIERVMQQLLKDNQQAIDDCEREADKRIKYVVVTSSSHSGSASSSSSRCFAIFFASCRGDSSAKYLGGRGVQQGFGGRALSRAQGQSLGQGLGGRSPHEAEALLVIWMFNRSRKFVLFSKIWKRKEIISLCYLCKKIMGGHETRGPGAKLGGGLCPPARV